MNEKPDLPSDQSELYCFKDQSRRCGADCMAYLTFAPDGQDYQGQPWAHCRLLVDSHRSAKHLAILTQTVRNESADRARQPKPPPLPR